jgi:hypothetical protein
MKGQNVWGERTMCHLLLCVTYTLPTQDFLLYLILQYFDFKGVL